MGYTSKTMTVRRAPVLPSLLLTLLRRSVSALRRSYFRIPFRNAALVAAFVAACLANSARWIDVPFVRQVRAGCGPAAIAMVMQYWVKHTPGLDSIAADAEHIDDALPATSKGTTGSELKRYLESHGFSTFVFTGEAQDLYDHLEKGRPIVVCLGLNGPDAPLHFTVVVGSGDDEFLLNDPARGKLFREKKAAFLRSWKATGYWALLAVPRQAP